MPREHLSARQGGPASVRTRTGLLAQEPRPGPPRAPHVGAWRGRAILPLIRGRHSRDRRRVGGTWPAQPGPLRRV